MQLLKNSLFAVFLALMVGFAAWHIRGLMPPRTVLVHVYLSDERDEVYVFRGVAKTYMGFDYPLESNADEYLESILVSDREFVIPRSHDVVECHVELRIEGFEVHEFDCMSDRNRIDVSLHAK